MKDLPQKYLKECFDYDPLTGVLTWKARPVSHFLKEKTARIINTKFSGKKAGSRHDTVSGKRYLSVRINKTLYLVHRVIWCLVFGYWPIQIDHDDGNGRNNKLNNMIDTDSAGNSKNLRLRPDNKSGCVGVSWYSQRGQWISYINVNKKRVCHRYFNDFFEAVCFRKSAEIKYGFNKNHGEIRPL